MSINQDKDQLSTDSIQKAQAELEDRVNDLVATISQEEQSRYALIKTAADSFTEHTAIVIYRLTNGSGRLFGGALLEMIDMVGAICARRHSGCEVTTAAIESLEFVAPAALNSTLLLTAEIYQVGRTSMKVMVKSFVEELSGNRIAINTAKLTFVALDRLGRPTPVPRLGKD